MPAYGDPAPGRRGAGMPVIARIMRIAVGCYDVMSCRAVMARLWRARRAASCRASVEIDD